MELLTSPEGEISGRTEGGAKAAAQHAPRKRQPPKPSTTHTFPTIATTYQTTVTVSRTIFLFLRHGASVAIAVSTIE